MRIYFFQFLALSWTLQGSSKDLWSWLPLLYRVRYWPSITVGYPCHLFVTKKKIFTCLRDNIFFNYLSFYLYYIYSFKHIWLSLLVQTCYIKLPYEDLRFKRKENFEDWIPWLILFFDFSLIIFIIYSGCF